MSELRGWLVKEVNGLFFMKKWQRRFFVLNNTPAPDGSSGSLIYYLTDVANAPRGTYLLNKSSQCVKLPPKSLPANFKGFGIMIRGIMGREEKLLKLVASSEAERDSWLSEINEIIAGKVNYSGWLHCEPPRLLGLWKRHWFILNSPLVSDSSNDDHLGTLHWYDDADQMMSIGSFEMFSNTLCYRLQQGDKAVSSDLTGYAFALCGGDKSGKSTLVVVAESEASRDLWVESIHNLLAWRQHFGGWAMKQGSFVNNWKRRYLTLSSVSTVDGLKGTIMYFDGDSFDSLKQPKGVVEITKDMSCEKIRAFDPCLPQNTDGFGLAVNSPQRTFRVILETEKEREALIRELMYIITGREEEAQLPGAASKKPRTVRRVRTHAPTMETRTSDMGYRGSLQTNNKSAPLAGSVSPVQSSASSNNAGNTSMKDSVASWKKVPVQTGSANTAKDEGSETSDLKTPTSTESKRRSAERSQATASAENENKRRSAERSQAVPPVDTETKRKSGKVKEPVSPDIKVASGSTHSYTDLPDISSLNVDPLPEGWEMVFTEDGKAYYYHQASRVSRWDRPTKEVASKVEERNADQQRRADDAVNKLKQKKEQTERDTDAKSKAQKDVQDVVNSVIESWQYYDPNSPKKEAPSNSRTLPELLALLPSICSLIPAEIIVSGIENSVDPSAVKKQYMKIVRVIHPDKLSASTTYEQRALIDAIYIIISEAYETWKTAFDL